MDNEQEKIQDAMAVTKRINKYGHVYTEDEVKQKIKERKQRRDRKERKEYSKHQDELKQYLLDSLSPVYKCCLCEEEPHIYGRKDEEFDTLDKTAMIEHFIRDHGLKELAFRPENPYDIDYIILNRLVSEFYDNEKKYRGKVYIMISNMDLWHHLLKELRLKPNDENVPSKQTLRHVLDKYELTKRGSRGKKRIGYDKKGNRVYHINIKDLRKAVSKTKFGDLILKCRMLDEDAIIHQVMAVEPPSIPSDSEQVEEKDTGDTGEFEEQDIFDDDAVFGITPEAPESKKKKEDDDELPYDEWSL